MKKLPRIVSVEPAIHGVLSVFTDGYEGVVDAQAASKRPHLYLAAEGQELPQSPIEEYGHQHFLD